MIQPSPLQQGDKVAIVSPSGAVDEQYVEGASQLLNSWGVQVELSPNALGQYGRFSASDAHRLADLEWALYDDQIKAVFCSRGGYGAVRLLSHLDRERTAQHPKWLIGYSDITLLHAHMFHSGIVSLHAPMARHLAEAAPDEGVTAYLRQTLFGEATPLSLPPHLLNRVGEGEGRVVGGNLSVLYGLRGTPYEPNYKGNILFIEDIAEAPYHIERMVYGLKLGGVLAELSGLVVGHFTRCNEDEGLGYTIYKMIRSLVSEYNYPLCFAFPVGHDPLNYPLLHGHEAVLNVSNQVVELKYK